MYRILLIWILCLASSVVSANRERDWSKMINDVRDSIVTIRVDAVRAFDTGVNNSSQASGFVVDAKQGIILTNRHVVQSGPVIAEALFANREEIELKPIYRDPVHDFGFFKYDPNALKFIKPKSLPIKPKEAVVGKEIRVVGNDAGEQLSILAGTLARLDRKAPYYGRGRYNDFNTFYYQSASGVSGGSSGSPVLDIHGNVIALNAGGSVKAASSFFLPLQRVERALNLIQKDLPVTRGTLQTTFDYEPYDELRRLGLRTEMEAKLRKVNHGFGMLVVRRSLPESSAHGVLKPGDIIIRGGKLNSPLKWLRRFEELAKLLDENVDNEVSLLIERKGRPVEVRVYVDDLHKLTPDRYLTFGQAIVHNLSYQQARHLNLPVEGVYVAQSGYLFSAAGVPRGAVIKAINKQPVKNIDDVETILAGLADGEQSAVQYITFKETRRKHLSIMRMDRKWFPLKKCFRDDRLGIWPCETLVENHQKEIVDTANVKFIEYKDKRANRLSSSIVMVQFNIPYHINGVQEAHYAGAGLIVDEKEGLVLVDRNTVPMSLGDVRVVFAGALDIPGEVLFVHPLHNLAIIKYDPGLLGETKVEQAALNYRSLEAGDDVWLIALRNDQELFIEKSKISSVDSLDFPLPKVPTFRETNLDVVSLHNAPPSRGGVLADKEGNVIALWMSFAYGSGSELKQYEWGVPVDIVEDLLSQWRCCGKFDVRSLEVELTPLSIAQARKLGLSDSWTEKFQDADSKRQVLAISRRVAASDAADKLQEGDLILTIDGKLMRNYRDVEEASQKQQVEVIINRLGVEHAIEVKTHKFANNAEQSVVEWSGALIQTPHRELSLQRGIEPRGVYVSYVFHGSPANRSNLSALLRIVEFNGELVDDLEQFIELVKKYRSEKFVQLKVLDLINRESVISVKQNMYYWPGRKVSRNAGEWRLELL